MRWLLAALALLPSSVAQAPVVPQCRPGFRDATDASRQGNCLPLVRREKDSSFARGYFSSGLGYVFVVATTIIVISCFVLISGKLSQLETYVFFSGRKRKWRLPIGVRGAKAM